MSQGMKTAACSAAQTGGDNAATNHLRHGVQGSCDEIIVAFVQRTTASCGVPELVDDVAVLDTIARLVRP
jgi:hypothetical protein